MADEQALSEIRHVLNDSVLAAEGYRKVWARGEEEPTEWTIEMTDESPNRAGSPGFFGNAQESEICIDNISITANE